MEIILLLLLLQLKHCWADFNIQTYMQTVRKGIYRDPVGISHSVDHVWTTLVALLIYTVVVAPIDPLLLVTMAVLEGIVHYHIDWFKVRYGCKDITKSVFWAHFGADQLAHQLTYLAMACIILL